MNWLCRMIIGASLALINELINVWWLRLLKLKMFESIIESVEWVHSIGDVQLLLSSSEYSPNFIQCTRLRNLCHHFCLFSQSLFRIDSQKNLFHSFSHHTVFDKYFIRIKFYAWNTSAYYYWSDRSEWSRLIIKASFSIVWSI